MPTVIHIGFLDYTLFEKYPEFYSTYKLMNVKNHKIYNDNFTLCVIDLSQIELAAKNEYLQEASKTMFELSADEQIRKQCLDREEYYQDLRNYEKAIIERDAAIAERDAAIAEKDALLRKTIAQRDDLLQKASVETERLRALLKKHGIDDSE
ncbi:MAG: hypothetical protein NC434_05835 [Ruminococcus sp.]|nr:hypothetical protein [Ruminococcus sp.]